MSGERVDGRREAEIEALYAKATPGEWRHGFSDGSGKAGTDRIDRDCGSYITVADNSVVVTGGTDDWSCAMGFKRQEDADCTVALHNAFPALLAELRRLRARAEAAEAVAGKLPKCWRLNEAGELAYDTPIVGGMTVWYIGGRRGNRYVADQRVEDMVFDGDRWAVNGWDPAVLFATKAAAEKAMASRGTAAGAGAAGRG